MNRLYVKHKKNTIFLLKIYFKNKEILLKLRINCKSNTSNFWLRKYFKLHMNETPEYLKALVSKSRSHFIEVEGLANNYY